MTLFSGILYYPYERKNNNYKTKKHNQKQWVNFLLELNLMKKAWKPYGVDVEIKAPGLKKSLMWGTKVGGQLTELK